MFLRIFDPRSSIVKSVFDCHLSGVNISLLILFLPYSANILQFSYFIALYITKENKEQLMKFWYLLHIVGRESKTCIFAFNIFQERQKAK